MIRKWQLPVDDKFDPAKAQTGEFKGHSKAASCIQILGNGKQCLSGSADGTARLWDISNGKSLRAFKAGGAIHSVSVSKDSARVSAIMASGVSKVWQVADGKQLFEMKDDLQASHDVVTLTERKTVAGQRVALADAAVKAADKDLKSRQAAEKKAGETKTAAEKAVADPEKKNNDASTKLAAAQKAFDEKPDDAKLKKTLDAAKKAATTAADKLKSAKAAVAAADRGLKLAKQAVAKATQWLKDANDRKAKETAAQADYTKQLTAAQAKQKQPLPGGVDICFAPNGRTLATLSADGSVRIRELTGGRVIESFSPVKGAVGIAYRDDSHLIVAAKDGVEWDLNPDWQLAGRLGPNTPDSIDVTSSEFEDRVVCVAYSHNGQLLATGGGEPSRNGELLTWNVQKQSLARRFKDAHSDTVFSVRFSYDDAFILSGAADKFVKQFDLSTGEHVRSFEGHTNHVMAVDWKADGATIASTGADNAIKVWNVETGEQRRTISTYKRQVTALQFIGTSDTILTGAGDKTVRFHNATNGRQLRAFGGSTDYIYSVCGLRDQSLVVGAGQDGTVRVWNGKDGKILHSFVPPTIPNASQASTQ